MNDNSLKSIFRDTEYVKHWISHTEGTRGHAYRWERQVVKTYIDKKDIKGQCALDIGTGGGIYAEILAAKFRNVIGYDLSPLALAQLKERVPSAGAVQGDAECLCFANSVFDLANCMETMTHLPYPEKALSEIYRVTKPKGIVIISFTCLPDEKAVTKWVKEMRQQQPRVIDVGMDYIVEHRSDLGSDLLIRSFTLKKIRRMLKDSQLAIRKVVGVGPKWPMWVFRIPRLAWFLNHIYRKNLSAFPVFNSIGRWIIVFAEKT
jgi:ubiquinone/menaquinone biosynthesis C-methylase UbiE